MIIKEHQEFKPVQRALGLVDDGIPGPKTLSAVSSWLGCFDLWTAVQAKVGATVDGIPGAETARAIAQAIGIALPQPDGQQWPTQAEVRSGTSIFGASGDEDAMEYVISPYQLYYAGQPVRAIRVHGAIADAVESALHDILEHYGAERIRDLGLDQYDGAFNDRATRGGSSKSMHAWGVAIDWYAEKNGMTTKAPAASLSHPDCAAFWDIWEKYGAVSLGRETGKDWMHVQFARL